MNISLTKDSKLFALHVCFNLKNKRFSIQTFKRRKSLTILVSFVYKTVKANSQKQKNNDLFQNVFPSQVWRCFAVLSFIRMKKVQDKIFLMCLRRFQVMVVHCDWSAVNQRSIEIEKNFLECKPFWSSNLQHMYSFY